MMNVAVEDDAIFFLESILNNVFVFFHTLAERALRKNFGYVGIK